MAKVEYKKIDKFFGTVEVIRDLNLAIDDGEFTVLLGPSGCGKTTLLRMTAGLESISGGELRIDNTTVNDLHPRDRDIAMVFQNYALYPTMTVAENIGFSLEVARVTRREIGKKVAAAAAMLNLSECLDRYPQALSGGQRQRVAMGRAMVRDAKVFLFDEPLSNLDAKLRAHMRVEIRQLHERLKATTIYVTHDQIEAMTMADKIVLMRGGRIEQMGSPDELFDAPLSKYAAEFIGSPSMNFLRGELTATDHGAIFCDGELRLPIPEIQHGGEGRRVYCGIRPTDVRIDPQGDLSGRLVIAEKTGADLHLHVSLQGCDFVIVAPRETMVAIGAEIRFSIRCGKAHLFDMASEQRIKW